MADVPIVYTIRGCHACTVLVEKWTKEGIQFEERRAEESDAVMDEARSLGTMVPIVVWPDGKIDDGYSVDGAHGCYI
ncbi:MAG: hypothetical protein EXR67_00080 [Dehalococcoidia bacterium]|nr:hypothetical protein [Dehalococcoidia bacterium]